MTQEAALVAAVDAVQATLERVEAGLETIATDASTSVADAALTAAEYLAARAIEDAPCAAIDAAITRVLAQVARGQELQIAVAPSLVGEMERLIAARQAGDRRRLALTVIADPSIVPGDAHIHWDQGGVLLDAAARRALLIETLQGDIR
jgi:flagellar assembly protein FliH